MNKNEVDFDFQFRVRNYLEYCFHEESEKEKEELIFNKLSRSIKDEYYNQVFGKKLRDMPFFSKNFSDKCLLSVNKIIHKMDFSPEETIFKKGEWENMNYFYIFKGNVELSIPSEKNNPEPFFRKILKEKDTFNESGFLLNLPQPFNIKTLTFCTVYYINRQEFVTLIRQRFPDDFEKFSMIKDDFLFDNAFERLYKPCFSCSSYSHPFLDCPFLHHVPNVDSILRKNIHFRPTTERKPAFRRSARILSHINTLGFRNRLEGVFLQYENENMNFSAPLTEVEDMCQSSTLYDEDGNQKECSNEIISVAHINDNPSTVYDISRETMKNVDEQKEGSPLLSFNQPVSKKRRQTKRENTAMKVGRLESEPDILKMINEQKKVVLQDKRKKSEYLGFNLFDFGFEKAKEFKIFYPKDNMNNVLKNLQKYLRSRERKKRKKLVINNTNISNIEQKI